VQQVLEAQPRLQARDRIRLGKGSRDGVITSGVAGKRRDDPPLRVKMEALARARLELPRYVQPPGSPQ
jgi:hypothetical protein